MLLFALCAGPAIAQDFEWADRAGNGGRVVPRGVAVDAQGNSYATGTFAGTVEFGGISLESNGGQDIFLVKYDPAGNAIWAQNWGSQFDDWTNAVAVDHAGNVYVTGSYQHIAAFGSASLNAAGTYGTNGFLVKVTPSGGVVSAIDLRGSSTEGTSVAVDAENNVYVGGMFKETLDLGGGGMILQGVNALYDGFVIKISAGGGYQWSRKFGGASNDAAWRVAVDSDQNVLVRGAFGGTVNFDPAGGQFTVTAQGSNDNYLIKLGPSGGFLWGAVQGIANWLPNTNLIGDVATDAQGNVYTAGGFFGTVDFDPGPGTYELTASSYRDIYICKLGPAGNFIWARNIGEHPPVPSGSRHQVAHGMALDSAANVYITGSFRGTVDFDPGPGVHNITQASTLTDPFVARYSTDGDFVWASAFHSTNIAIGYSVAVDNSGNVFTAGEFKGTADFDPGPDSFMLSSETPNSNDFFLVKLSQSPTVGITEAAHRAGLVAHPNPTNGEVTIAAGQRIEAIVVRNALGQELDRHDHVPGNTRTITLPAKPGVYI
ncbi:MAG: hypothetical protein RBT71_14570, partial [Flavobacteriales bacterium]|nr:hypothetical protein [Flavobacteriales bacterium]